jgi:hypothetical protein
MSTDNPVKKKIEESMMGGRDSAGVLDAWMARRKPEPPRRLLCIKFFLGSTLEEIQQQMDDWLSRSSTCVGNYADLKLWKHGSVYQCALVHAVLVGGE